MRRISINGVTYAAPYADLLPTASKEVLEALEASIILDGVLIPVVTGISPTHGRIIIDGVTRAEIAERHELRVPVDDYGDVSDTEARAQCESLNANRRHLTPETFAGLRVRIMQRIAACRANGKSIRATVEELKTDHPSISKSAVGRAVQALRQVSRSGTVDDDEEEIDPDDTPFPLEPDRVTGMNGKTYLATKAPVIVAKVPPNLDRDAALIELGKARKCAATLTGILDELMRGPLKKDMRKAALAWEKFAAELEAVEAA